MIKTALTVIVSFGLGWFYMESRSLAKKNKAITEINDELISEASRSDKQYLYMIQKTKEDSMVDGCYKTIEILCSRYLESKQVKCRNDLNSACQEIL